MNRFITLLAILAFALSCTQRVDIEGKWYIHNTTNLATGDNMVVSLIGCPYFDFKPNGEFAHENGMGLTAANTWHWNNSDVEITGPSENYSLRISLLNDTLILENGDLRFVLLRKCNGTSTQQ